MGIEVWDEERIWRAGQPWHRETAAAAASAAAASAASAAAAAARGQGRGAASSNDLERLEWYYHDAHGQEQGPFTLASMRQWYRAGYFSAGAAGSAEAKKGIDGEYIRISSLLQITGGQPPAAAAAVGQVPNGLNTGVEELDERSRRMQGAAAQEAMRGRERFAGIGHTGVQEQEALLAQAKAQAAAAAAATAIAAATAAAAAANPAAKVAAARKKKVGGGGFLGSLKEQAKKTLEAQERHKHSDLDDVAKQGAAFTPVHYQR